MKKGFTMIELIFVIVILGILAAVAIPRLTATKDDAEAAAMITSLSQATTEMASLFLAKGEPVAITNIKAYEGNKNLKKCVTLSYADSDGKDVTEAGDGNKIAYIKIVKATGDVANTPRCKALYQIPSFKEKYQENLGVDAAKNGKAGLIKVGGTGIYDEVKK